MPYPYAMLISAATLEMNRNRRTTLNDDVEAYMAHLADEKAKQPAQSGMPLAPMILLILAAAGTALLFNLPLSPA